MGGAYRWTELFDIYANCYKEIEAIPFDAAGFGMSQQLVV
jgi:hypothetical protein